MIIKYEYLSDENKTEVFKLIKELVSLGSFNDLPFDEKHTMKTIEHSLRTPGYFTLLSKDTEYNEYTGIVAGHLSQMLFAPITIAIEMCWYVREGAYQRTLTGKRLMQTFEKWAFDNGAKIIQTGEVAGINSVAIDRMYRLLGFSRAGTIYQKRAK